MAEYIDREAAIKSICHEKCRTEYGECQKGKHDDKIILCVCDFLRFLPAVSVPQWISVKDRRPENKTRNIVLRYDHVTKTHFVDILWFCGNGWFCNPLGSGAEDKSISCWMPLPKPPKGENDG